ncbi:sulfate adenylyltransferase, partial [Vibrio sp. M260118]
MNLRYFANGLVTLIVVLLATTASFALNTQEQRWVDAVRQTYGDRAAKRVETWRREMAVYKTLPEREKLTKVNAFFNQLNFVNDIHLWGKNDYWA